MESPSSVPPTPVALSTEPTVREDDEFWMDYCSHARIYDRRMIDHWAKIVDVILVYVSLLTSALSGFTIETIRDFHPNPGVVTNQILIAIYNQTMNVSSPIDLEKFLRLDKNTHKRVVYRNAALSASLASAIIIGVVATMARIWIIRYDREVNAPDRGPPRSHVTKRQEMFDGFKLQEWGLGEFIEGLPIMTLTSVFLFGLFILDFIGAEDQNIGFSVTVIFQLGLCYLFVASFCGAFISDAPFHSSISYFTSFIFSHFPNRHFKLIGKKDISVRPIGIIFASLTVLVAVPYLVTQYHPHYMALIYFPVAAVFALMVKAVKKDIHPRRWSLPFYIFWTAFVGFIAYSIAYLELVSGPWTFYGCFIFATFLLAIPAYMVIKMSAVKPATTTVNAVSWMLKTSPSLEPAWFQKAVQIAGHSHNLRVLLLEDLLPLAEPLILRTSSGHGQGNALLQEAYLKSLEDLMDVYPVKGSIWRNAAPIPSKTLKGKLKDLKNVKCPQMTEPPRESCRLGAEVCPHCRLKLVAKHALEKFVETENETPEEPSELHEKQAIEHGLQT